MAQWSDDLAARMIRATAPKDTGRLRASIIGGLDRYAAETSEEDETRYTQMRHENQARRLRESTRHAGFLASSDAVTRAVAGLHSPADSSHFPECDGCDFGGYEGDRPSWPCRTWELLDESAVP